jgi:glycine/D-amino acid oxidase-like deaminating enzyme
MPSLLVIGGGLFGSQAAAYARSKGIEALVFDPGLEGAASGAAAGLFKEAWAGRKGQEHYHEALPVLERLYGIRRVQLVHDDGAKEEFLCVPPTIILEPEPIRHPVTAVGAGWLEAAGRRYEGWVYVAAGVWSGKFLPGLSVVGKAGSSFLFQGEHGGRMRGVAPGRQAVAFVRDPGTTYFSDGTAEQVYSPEHDRQSLARAAALGLSASPILRCHGSRPYTPGGAFFQKIASHTWLATGGRKMGTILGASFARRLVEKELRCPSVFGA